jgi:hypothetical protein
MYAGMKGRLLNEQMIEFFDLDLVSVANNAVKGQSVM